MLPLSQENRTWPQMCKWHHGLQLEAFPCVRISAHWVLVGRLWDMVLCGFSLSLPHHVRGLVILKPVRVHPSSLQGFAWVRCPANGSVGLSIYKLLYNFFLCVWKYNLALNEEGTGEILIALDEIEACFACGWLNKESQSCTAQKKALLAECKRACKRLGEAKEVRFGGEIRRWDSEQLENMPCWELAFCGVP